MSPRAAWRLEADGFTAYDYVAGKSEWLAADLPFEGEARLAGQAVRRNVPSVRDDASAREALDALDRFGFGPVVVVNAAGVVVGTLRGDDLVQSDQGQPVGSVVRFGVSTVRPSEQVEELAHRMGHADVTRVVVTRSDGTLVGLLFTEDLSAQPE